MDYFICDTEQFEDEDQGTVTRPTIARHVAAYNTQSAYDPVSGRVLVQCQPTVAELALIEADATIDYLTTTLAEYQCNAVRGSLRAIPNLNNPERSRLQTLLSNMGLNITISRDATTDEVAQAVTVAIRSRR